MTLLPLMVGFLGLATVLAIVPLILAFCRRAELQNQRPDLHHGQAPAVPRLGGAALAAAYIFVTIFAAILGATRDSKFAFQPAIFIGCLAMFAIGFIDDLKPLGAKKKLLL